MILAGTCVQGLLCATTARQTNPPQKAGEVHETILTYKQIYSPRNNDLKNNKNKFN